MPTRAALEGMAYMQDTLFHGDLVISKRILYTPSGFAKRTLLHLQEIGELEARRPHVSQRDGLSSYLFFIVLRGSGELAYRQTVHPLSAGDCVFVDCKQGYAHSTSADLWTLKWIHFFGPELRGIYEKYVERGGRAVFSPGNISSFLELWERIFFIAASAEYIRDMRINELLAALLTLLMENSWNPSGGKSVRGKRQNLQQVRDYLDENFAQKISLDALCGRFYMSRSYLSRAFKAQFGVNISEYLLGLRITRAKQLLRFSDDSVADIAASCGFDDANFFARTFKKVEGVSPSQFRASWRS